MKEKILKTLKEKIFAYDPVHEWNIPSIAGFEQAAEEIAKLFSWIPVSERLPEDNKEVLFCTNVKELNGPFLGDSVSGFFDSGDYVFNSKEVTHWYELPELPKEA
jgi:hypothetical protein